MNPASGFRGLPAVHALADDARLATARERQGRALVVDASRLVLEEARVALRAGRESDPDAADAGDKTDVALLCAAVLRRLSDWLEPRPRVVINATGVILHTNLGRAPVSAVAAEAMRAAAAGYSDLEYDLPSGRRGSRHDLVTPLLCQLSGAPAALVVNNNAGATLLVLSALAQGRGVVVSRGQLVEIGGGYRIPDIMAAGGARLVEVGTTNRTRISDYRAAIDAETGLILRVHTSNYRIVGFTETPSLEALVSLGREQGLPVVDDLGSGSFLDSSAYGLAPEPMVQASVTAGAELVTFSGDKLLGGPQAGIIVGQPEAVARLRRHPLTRALRPGKDVLAGLHATLVHYARGEATREVPVWRMISATQLDLAARAEAWRVRLADRGVAAELRPGQSAVGGGSLPGETLPSTLLAILDAHPDRLAARLRGGQMPVVALVESGAVLLDPRTVLPEQDELLLAALVAAAL
ncbi:MAG TPA: L-seryl-tRNA(Sec) selenium transferase [Anaerolineae bacterium]|nr:L-seryl-tRNA(Sec) selenium transferase [Anaerolineae bacterium]